MSLQLIALILWGAQFITSLGDDGHLVWMDLFGSTKVYWCCLKLSMIDETFDGSWSVYRHWCLVWIYFLYLILGLSSSQFSPWGNRHLSFVHPQFSRFLSFCSICLPPSPCFSLTMCSGWTPMLWMLWQLLPGLKCLWRVPGILWFVIWVRCLLNLIFSDCEVCPTYCLLHFLHCMRYTMYGVSQLDLPCVLYVLVVVLLICEEWRSLSCNGQY